MKKKMKKKANGVLSELSNLAVSTLKKKQDKEKDILDELINHINSLGKIKEMLNRIRPKVQAKMEAYRSKWHI